MTENCVVSIPTMIHVTGTSIFSKFTLYVSRLYGLDLLPRFSNDGK